MRIDPSGKLTKVFQNKSYITDEYSCFNKLKKIYNLKIYKCFAHLIRSVGSNSILGFLLRDMLFSFTETDFIKDQTKNAHILKYLYDNNPKKKRSSIHEIGKSPWY